MKKRHSKPGIYIEAELLDAKAFQELTRRDLDVYFLFLRKRQVKNLGQGQGKRREKVVLNNGQIIFPYREAEEALRMKPGSFTRCLDHLIELGFIEIARPGGFCAGANEPALYTISERWRKYGKPDFKETPRKKKSVRVGFQNKRVPYGKS